MTLVARLLDTVPGVALPIDDLDGLERWTAGRALEDALVDVLADLPVADARAAVALMESGVCAGVLVARDDHPDLADLAAWCNAEEPAVVLVASPSGPPPPAVFVLEKGLG